MTISKGQIISKISRIFGNKDMMNIWLGNKFQIIFGLLQYIKYKRAKTVIITEKELCCAPNKCMQFFEKI